MKNDILPLTWHYMAGRVTCGLSGTLTEGDLLQCTCQIYPFIQVTAFFNMKVLKECLDRLIYLDQQLRKNL